MFTFQELHERLQKLAGYRSSDDIQFGKDLINEAQKYIANLRNWEWTEVEYSFTTVADQSEIKLPANYRKLISFKVNVNGIDYIPYQITDPARFDRIRAINSSITSDYPTYYHIRGNRLLVYPAFSSAGNTGTLLYQLRPIDMLDDDETTGTITVTVDDETVAGVGTDFTDPTDIGKYLQVTSSSGDRKWYKIASIASTTSLELDIPYEGSTQAGVNYRISELPVVPEDFQEIIWMWALSRWYILKSDEQTAAFYVTEAERLITEMEKRYSKKAHNNVTPIFSETVNINPNFDPGAITLS